MSSAGEGPIDDYSLFDGDGPTFFLPSVDQDACDRTWEYAVSLAHREVDDREAVQGIWAAAGGDERIVEAIAEKLERCGGISRDPLLHHVVEIASAAKAGTAPQPMSDDSASIAAIERKLIGLPLMDAYEVLASRQRALREVAAVVTTPGWIDQHRRPLKRSERMLSWVEDRLPMPPDLRTKAHGDRKPSERIDEKLRAEPAMREMVMLLRPAFASSKDDPVFRTKVAQLVCRLHLLNVSGAIPSWKP